MYASSLQQSDSQLRRTQAGGWQKRYIIKLLSMMPSLSKLYKWAIFSRCAARFEEDQIVNCGLNHAPGPVCQYCGSFNA